MKLINFLFPEDLIKEIKRLSCLESLTVSTWVREALWKVIEEKTGNVLPQLVKEAYRRKTHGTPR